MDQMFCQRVSFLSGFFVDSAGSSSPSSRSSGRIMSTIWSGHSLTPAITVSHSATPSQVKCLQIRHLECFCFREREIFGSISSVHSQGAMSLSNNKLRRSNSHVESIVWKKKNFLSKGGNEIKTCSDRKMNCWLFLFVISQTSLDIFIENFKNVYFFSVIIHCTVITTI